MPGRVIVWEEGGMNIPLVEVVGNIQHVLELQGDVEA